jgi:tRNA uridine 5-carbamoylmethylation protein Kti12
MESPVASCNAVLVLLCGLPGAGKSTLARSVASALGSHGEIQSKFAAETGSEPRVKIVSFDEVEERIAEELADGASVDAEELQLEAWRRSRKEATHEVECALRDGANVVVVDDNLYYRSMRYTFCQLARRLRIGLCMLFLDCDPAEARRRNAARTPVERVPDEVIARMESRLERPDAVVHKWERHSVVLSAASSAVTNEPHAAIAALLAAWHDPRLEEEQRECAEAAAAKDRARNRESLLHAADLALRGAVAAEMGRAAAAGLSASHAHPRCRPIEPPMHAGLGSAAFAGCARADSCVCFPGKADLKQRSAACAAARSRALAAARAEVGTGGLDEVLQVFRDAMGVEGE